MDSFNETRFRSQVDKALQKVKTILENQRDPQYPANVPHTYDDKYLLAEVLTNTALASQLNVLHAIGLDEKALQQLHSWSKTNQVTLRFASKERCVFEKETTRKVESPTQHVTEIKGGLFGDTKITDKVVTTITEYFWKYSIHYKLYAYKGTQSSSKKDKDAVLVVLRKRRADCQIITTTKPTPKPQVTSISPIEVNITWLLNHLDDNLRLNFSIDRQDKKCHTPRRNQPIDSALKQFREIYSWNERIHRYFTTQIFPTQAYDGFDLSAISDVDLFVPVVPLFEESSKHKALPSTTTEQSLIIISPSTSTTASNELSSLLPLGDVNNFLNEQKRGIQDKFNNLNKVFPETTKLITPSETTLLVMTLHSCKIAQHFADGVDYIEHMLYKQLIAAIGKEVTSLDFTNYMRFHNRKLFKPQYQPTPFCYAIRRPDHYPEGTLSIEDGDLQNEPVLTCVRKVEPVHPMNFSINAATKITFTGDRYLHAWMNYQFAGNSSSSNFQLVARARQFSSFMLVIGTIASSTVFEPKHAIILQNKDDLKIPLLLEQLPTPKEFRDAIESMSEEQQRFCKAYRAMQLESTLFGVLIIQIKPQLEKLLKLPNDSLTKEIELTQNLLELFIKYQIPSDLLTYEGPEAVLPSTKLNQVKEYVKTMQDMIKQSKEKELAEQKQTSHYNYYESTAAPISTFDSFSYLPQSSLSTTTTSTSSVVRSSSVAPTLLRSAAPGSRGGGGAPIVRSSAAPVTVPVPAPVPAPVAPPVVMQQQAVPVITSQQPQQQQQQQEQSKQQQQELIKHSGEEEQQQEIMDYTKLPVEIDKKFETLDKDNALRSTIIKTGDVWNKTYQKNLLDKENKTTIYSDEQNKEKNKAFDLLDALSRSGSLAIEDASLHVIVAATHCFDKTLVNTIIQDNINPIEKVERSSLIMASTIQRLSATELIKQDQLDRVKTYSSILFESN